MKDNKIAQMKKLIEKAKKWNENWTLGMMEYIEEDNIIMVWVGRSDIYKAWFDADTLECRGTKC